jgi:diguanylate cyclase (GGDEF)-like protein
MPPGLDKRREGFLPRNAALLTLVTLLALSATLLAAHFSREAIDAAARHAFEERTVRAEAAMLERLRGYESAVRGGAGLFAATDELTVDEWQRYVASLRLNDVFPGVRGMHFAPRVRRQDRPRHVGVMRAVGFPEYELRPAGEADESYPVAWVAPLDERNQRALGFDMYSEPVRREAMQRARDSGLPTLSGRVVLAGEDPASAPTPGFVLYFPVYARGAPLGSIQERQAAITGFVFCPFRMLDLVQGVLGDSAADVRVEVYDGAVPGAANWLYLPTTGHRAVDAMPGEYSKRRRIEVGGRVWTMVYEATPGFVARIDQDAPFLILAAGALLTLLLGALTTRLLMSEARAQEASMRDSLTGLFNRRYLDETLKREEERARRSNTTIGVIQFDLDRFKNLNDSRGHDAGDMVLKAVAGVIESQTRTEDVACRYGGEELTVVLPGASLADAKARAEQLRSAVEALQVVQRGETLPTVTISAGVAAFPEHGADMNAVLHQADQALLRAKQQGRNRIIVA